MNSLPKPTRKPDDYFYDADTYWARESKRLLAACLADPTDRQRRKDLAWAEKQREVTHEKAAAEWEREQEREYARQGNTYDGDHIFDTMSGGSVIR